MSDVASFAQEFSQPTRPPSNKHPNPWTPERVERAKSLAAQNYSNAEIAADIDPTGLVISRNAVIGKLNRLGLSTGNSKGTRTQGLIGRKTRSRGAQRKARLDEIFDLNEATDLPPEQSDCAITFFQAKDGDRKCRFPIGDPRNLDAFRYCGAPQADECGTYCARHFRVTHRRLPEINDAERQRRSFLGKRMATKNNALAGVP